MPPHSRPSCRFTMDHAVTTGRASGRGMSPGPRGPGGRHAPGVAEPHERREMLIRTYDRLHLISCAFAINIESNGKCSAHWLISAAPAKLADHP